MKHAIFFLPHNKGADIALELMEQCLRHDSRVTVLFCCGELPSCFRNPDHLVSECFLCRARQAPLLQAIGRHRVAHRRLYPLSPSQMRALRDLDHINLDSIADVKAVSLEGSDIGMAAISSVATLQRTANIDIPSNEHLLRRNLAAAAFVHFSIKNALLSSRPEQLYLFNGRLAEFRPAMRIASALGVEALVFERSTRLDKYTCFRNTYTLDTNYVKSEIERWYEQSPFTYEEKRNIAFEWYEARRAHNSLPIAGALAGKRQTPGLIPDSLTKEKVNVAIITSSDQEFAAIKELENHLYPSQNDAIYCVLKDFQGCNKIRFFIRAHPNLAWMDREQAELYRRYDREFGHLELIEAESPVDTYALVEACDITLAFGPSTMTMEAVYMGKPVILMSRAFHEDLGGLIRPSNHRELVQVLNTYLSCRELPKTHSGEEGAVKYGFYYQTYGNDFLYVKEPLTPKVFVRQGRERYYDKVGPLAMAWYKLLNKAESLKAKPNIMRELSTLFRRCAPLLTLSRLNPAK